MKAGATAAALVAALAVGAAGGRASSSLSGTVFVRFEQQLLDGGTRELGRTGCYELGTKVKATVESCNPNKR